MSAAPPEFSRLIPVASLGPEPFRQEIEATESERAALARRFGLLGLDRLTAVVRLAREHRVIRLNASFEAEFVQECVVTLEPVPGSVTEEFSLRYGPPEAEEEVDPLSEDDVFEPLTAEAIDIGEAAAQQFSLALPLFPRDPAAMVENEPELPHATAFAALSRLRGRE